MKVTIYISYFQFFYFNSIYVYTYYIIFTWFDFRWLTTSVNRHFFVGQDRRKRPPNDQMSRTGRDQNIAKPKKKKKLFAEWNKRDRESARGRVLLLEQGSDDLRTWSLVSKLTVASVSERQQNKQTCLSITMVCGDDLLLCIRCVFVPGDLHHLDVSGWHIATRQDRLLLCQGTYGIAWRKLQKFSPYHWYWKKCREGEDGHMKVRVISKKY